MILGFILLILFITFFIVNILYKKTNYYQNLISNVKKFIDGVDNDIELASFGSSYSKYGILPNEIPTKKAFNFGIQPESIHYDFKMLKMYTNHLKKGCIVLLNIPNLVFTFVDYSSEQANTKYYYFMDKQYIKNYKNYKKFLIKYFPILRNPYLLRYILKDVRKDDYDARIETKLDVEGVKKEAILRIEGWKKNAKLNNTIDAKVSTEMRSTFEKTQKILEDMIEYCIANNFKPVIVIPPVSSVLLQMLSKEFMRTYLYDNIEKANKRKIPILDYLYREEMQDYKLYINADFMNVTGRKLLTKTIIQDLKSINYL